MGPGATGVLILGCGFLGQVLAQRLTFKGIPVIGTARGEPQLGIIRTRGAQPLPFTGELAALDKLTLKIDRVVMSIPPEAGLDEALAQRVAAWGVAPGKTLYVSSTSVYGDRGGADTDEATPVNPQTPKAEKRVEAERIWQKVGASVIRPAGIYGPGRSLMHRIAAGKYRQVGDGQAIVNRIHVSDLAALCEKSLGAPQGTWLGADLAPTPHAEVIGWLCEAFGLPAPPVMPLAEARIRMDRETLSMFSQSKRLRPEATLTALGVKLRFPSYREGFKDVWTRDKAQLEAMMAGGSA
ncbi:MAG TPA: NAD-dependent epimerase/dehydratase family protein [Myxococcota bacterium]|nr:NAD-dependent epimerase/dehydratase family protein [Myxococcota bacterium]